MKNIYKILLFIGLTALVSLSAYSFKLNQQINDNKAKIDELMAIVNKSKSIAMENKISFDIQTQMLERLNKDYVSRTKFGIQPNYVKYKETITGLLGKQISTIVTEKPLQQGTWILSKAEFLSPVLVYAVYEDGHGMHATFIQITKANNGYVFNALY